MTIYRRRASSSPEALRRSLQRRHAGLRAVIAQHAFSGELERADPPEAIGDDDLPEGEDVGRISAAYPDDPEVARTELVDVERLLQDLGELGALDSKRDKFFDLLRQVTEDGRPALVFTEYTDTMEYLRDALADYYGGRLGCYSGEGGLLWDGIGWKLTTKDAITRALREGRLSVLICTDAASEGLNLQAAGAIINYDLPWNPSRVEQRIGRIDRIGQRHPTVEVINLFLKDSVDERVYRVLRQRCQLFEHFVGAMQPVLARARRMLMAGAPADVTELEAAAAAVEQDPLAGEIYLESGAEQSGLEPAAYGRDDLVAALRELDGSLGPVCRSRADGKLLELSGAQVAKTRLACSVEALEADRTVRPASPFTESLRDLADVLCRPGERLPLAIGSAQQGTFRTSVALWVGQGTIEPVNSLDQLRRFVENWDGTFPDPGEWRGAEEEASRKAAEVVRLGRAAADKRVRNGLVRQTEAAQLRLLRELGRYLVCASGTIDGLNDLLYQQMTREIAGARRLRRCLEMLGGYPDWSDALREELNDFYRQTTETQRETRLLGSQLEAALQDPRWGTQAKRAG